MSKPDKSRNFKSSKLGCVIGWRSREGRSQSRDSGQFKNFGSSQHSGSFTENLSEQIYTTGGSTGPQTLSDKIDMMAESLEGVSKAVQRLQQRTTEILQRQRTIENRLLCVGDYQKIWASKLHKALTDLAENVDGQKSELNSLRVLWLSSRVKRSQVAMLLFSQGLLSKYEASVSFSRAGLVDQARAVQRTVRTKPGLLCLMAASLLSLVIALINGRVRSLPPSVRRALRCVHEVCKTTCLVSLGAMWDFLRKILMMILKWLTEWLFG